MLSSCRGSTSAPRLKNQGCDLSRYKVRVLILKESQLTVRNAIAPTLIHQVTADRICRWQDLPPLQQQRFLCAIVPGTEIDCIAYPSTPEELAQIVTLAHQNRWKILPCGNASKLSWGPSAHGIDLGVSTAKLNRLIEHAVGDLTVTVEAGMTLADLQAVLARAGQFLPIDPLYAEQATLGGIVSTASAGSLRQRYGGIRDLLVGVSFVRQDGQIAKAGGRVVKNVAGYDLMKLFTGSFGTLGILTQLTFRIYAQPEASQSILLTATAEVDNDSSQLRFVQAIQTILASELTPTAMDLLSPATVRELTGHQGMGLLLRFQTIAAGVQAQLSRLQELALTLGLQSTVFRDLDEPHLWQKLRETIESPSQSAAILCKIGVSSTVAASTLTQINTLTGGAAIAWIHAGSGIGGLRLREPSVSPQLLLQIRQDCQEQGGFLTVLEAPVPLKQQIDVWGYTGNALALMRGIKQQFDAHCLFSPQRSVGGL